MIKPFAIIFTSLLLMPVLFAQPNEQDMPAWDLLKAGMSEIQVKQLIGEPTRLEAFTTVRYNSYDTSVYWRYPNNAVVVFTNHLLDRVETDRDALLRYIQQRAFKKQADGLVIVNNARK